MAEAEQDGLDEAGVILYQTLASVEAVGQA